MNNGTLGLKTPVETFETNTCKNGTSRWGSSSAKFPQLGAGDIGVRVALGRQRKAACPRDGKSGLELLRASISPRVTWECLSALPFSQVLG